MNSREAGVIAGLPLAEAAFRLINPAISFEALVEDGARVEPGTMIARISGPARGVLSAERVALNYLMHLSGIATHTARFADAIAHTSARVTCTRKTLPGLRAVEKYAVRCGGGSSHRYGLDDAILIKDNHIAVAGGIVQALQAARAFAGHLVRIEIEVDTLEQFAKVLKERRRRLPARQYGARYAARRGRDEHFRERGPDRAGGVGQCLARDHYGDCRDRRGLYFDLEDHHGRADPWISGSISESRERLQAGNPPPGPGHPAFRRNYMTRMKSIRASFLRSGGRTML